MSVADNSVVSAGGKRPKVAVLTMQKNEGKLIESWLKYYEAMFGASGLFVFDNGSTDEITLSCLREAKLRGIFVEARPNPGDFEAKGTILLEKARSLFDEGFDLAYFADADEFLVLNNNEVPAAEPGALWDELARINCEPFHIFRINMGWFNVPNSAKVFGSEPGSKKLILRKGLAKDFVLDVGFHFWDWEHRCDKEGFGGVGKTKLGYLHFHNKPYEQYIVSAKEKLKQRVPDFSEETLKNYKGSGVHLVHNLLRTADEYYASFGNLGQQNSASIDIDHVFRSVGLRPPYSGG
jgi:hypothetical protein